MSAAVDTSEASAGRYGPYGGRFVPETLMPALEELTIAWDAARVDPAFLAEYHRYLKDYVGRPSRSGTCVVAGMFTVQGSKFEA